MRTLIAVIFINIMFVLAAHTAQAQTLSDKVTEWTNEGYSITATGVTSAGTSSYMRYWVQFYNPQAPDLKLVHCERYANDDSDIAKCYKM
jgi:hypothetical protein